MPSRRQGRTGVRKKNFNPTNGHPENWLDGKYTTRKVSGVHVWAYVCCRGGGAPDFCHPIKHEKENNEPSPAKTWDGAHWGCNIGPPTTQHKRGQKIRTQQNKKILNLVHFFWGVQVQKKTVKKKTDCAILGGSMLAKR